MLLDEILHATYATLDREGVGHVVVSVMDTEARLTEVLLHPVL